jgi:hypothetical protein
MYLNCPAGAESILGLARRLLDKGVATSCNYKPKARNNSAREGIAA